MKIPHSFQVDPIAAPKVRKINDKTMQANAIQEQATQGLVAGVDAAVQTGNEIYQTHIDKQYATDMVAGSAMMEQFKFQRDAEIKKIPVDSSVDYAAEVKKIEARANANWSGWSDKNIRNKNHPRVREARQQSIDAFEIDGAATAAMLGVQYEDARNVDNLKVADGLSMQQLEVDPNNPVPLEKLKQNQIALVHLGAQTEGEAKENIKNLDSHVEKLSDSNTLARADVAILDGDTELFDAEIDSLKGSAYTKDEKTKIKRKGKATLSYNKANEIFSVTRGTEDLKQLSKDIASKTVGKDMGAGHRAAINSNINGRLRTITRSHTRKRSALSKDAGIRGIYDEDLVESLSTDTIDGIGFEDLESYKATLIAAADSHAKGEATKAVISAVKSQESYKTVHSKVTAGILKPENFNIESVMTSIQKKNFHPSVEAELMGQALNVADVQFAEVGEFDTHWLPRYGDRAVGSSEKAILKEYVAAYRALVDEQGVKPTLAGEFNAGVALIRDAYEDKGASSDKIREAVIKPVKDQMLTDKMRGDTDSAPKAGSRWEQDGLIYEFDGTNYIEVD